MNLTCKKVAELLADYIDGDLPDDQKGHLDWHFCGCVPCKIYLFQYREIIVTSRQLPDAPMPPEFAQRLQKAMEEAKKD